MKRVISFFELFIFFFFSASGLSEANDDFVLQNNHADGSLIVQQDFSYRKNVNDAVAPEHWKRRYTDEEHRNANPEVVNFERMKTHINIEKMSRSIDLKTRIGRVEPTEIYNNNINEKNEMKINKDLSGIVDIIDTTAYPYSTVVKIFFTKNNGSISMCSGTLIDPSIVITAAHCVHDGSFNWYSNFEIIPAYYQRFSGIAGIAVLDQEPFGRAYGTHLSSWEYSDSDMSSDIAVINIDRPVGGLTRWLNLGTSNNCSTVTGRQYTSAGYPAYDTRFSHCLNYSSSANQMVEHSGTFDSCVSGNALNNTDITCGGQSGSAYWDSDSTVRVILSGASGDKGQAAMIEDYEYNSMTAFETQHLPTEVQLVPLGMIATESLGKGEQFSVLKFTVLNHSSQNFTGNVDATVYLSDNKTISSSDTSLGTYRWTSITRDAKNFGKFNITSPPTIPTYTPPGVYYIGVIIKYTFNGKDIVKSMSDEDVQEITIENNEVNGVCGSSNGGKFISIPSVNLCLSGEGSTVYGSGPWNWTCYGQNGGTNSYCSAQLDSIRDNDKDGMPDYWEILNNLNPNIDDSALDADGDGASNLKEYLSGTDPNDNKSFPKLYNGIRPALYLLLN